MLTPKKINAFYLKAIFSFILVFATLVATAQANRANTKKSAPLRANYQRISAGQNHTLEIRNGTLWAWGNNFAGELGDGTNMNKSSPVQIGVDDKWVSITAGQDHSLGLKSDGTLWAWGYNNVGQLGDGTNVDKNSPVQIGADTKWISISAGSNHTLGLKSDGTLWAWGYNQYGRLGDGTTVNKNSPVQIGVDNKWQSISAGYFHSLGLKSDGTSWAWGYNSSGQLGDGTTVSKSNPVLIGADNKWVNIVAGGNHSFGSKSDGTIWGWGNNSYGQLGDGTNVNKNSPIQIGSENKWINIAGGVYHTLGIKSDGTLWAWGFNNSGQLGEGSTVDKNIPIQIGTDSKWVGITAGFYHTLGLKSDGTLWAWGNNSNGQLGDGTVVDNSSPIQTSIILKVWLCLTGGQYHSLGIQSDGTLWAWGNNSNGQLGDGTLLNKNIPVQIGTDNKWVSITTGYSHTLGLKSDGTLWAWGFNFNGQLGDGTTSNKSSPVQVGVDTKWVSITAGAYHSLGLKSDGTLWAWGNNQYGRLGDGTTINKSNPVQIGIDNKWVSIIAGEGHSMGLKSDGTLWTWGWNTKGQLGDGTLVNKSSPIQTGADNKWLSITAGAFHTLGTKSDGTLWAWGYNFNGQLGDGTTVDKSSPIQIGTDSKWLSVTTGGHHTFGVKSEGTLWAWGSNSNGQLGDGSFVNKSSPIQIGADTKWINITAGFYHTLGLKSDRVLFCASGHNTYGQLGNCNTTESDVFVCSTIPMPPPAPTNTTPGVNLIICSGSSTTLTVSGTGTLGWYNAPAAGTYLGGGATYTTPILNNIATYYVQDSSACGGLASTLRTAIVVNVNSLPTVSASATAQSVCAGDSVKLMGGGAATYTWTGGVTDDLSFIPLDTTTFTVTGTDTNSCTDTETITIYVNTLPNVTANASSTVVCAGTSVTLTGGDASTYTWSSGVINGGGFIPSSTNTYTVTGTDINGCQNTDTITISVNQLPIVTASVANDTICLGNSTTLTASGATNYAWSANAGSAVSASVSVSPLENTSYTVTGTDTNSCSNTASLTVNVLAVTTPSICMVTVDAASVNNIIYWDKTLYTNADSFIVYREVSTQLYKRIGAVSVDSLSEYIDTARSVGPANGNPNVGSYRYKLQLRDTCGNYSEKSPYHNTIYIIDAGLGQFTWSIPYTIEGLANPVDNYILLCDTANIDFWIPVGTVAGTQSSATDPGFADHPTIANWRVKTVWGISCDPTRATINTTRSNIKGNNISIGILAANELSSTIAVYPNPAKDNVTIEFSILAKNAELKIINVLGQAVYSENVTASTAKNLKQINTSTFSKGIYTIIIETDIKKAFKKLVID